ncbi:MAG: LysR substrate-binding domain-containing protein [Moorellales bacterium]
MNNLLAELARQGPQGPVPEETTGVVEVVSDPLAGTYLLPRLVDEFRGRSPGIGVRLAVNSDHSAISGAIRRGTCDPGVMPAGLAAPGTTVEFTFGLDLVAVANRDLVTTATGIDWAGTPLALPKGGGLRRTLDAYFASLGIKPRVAFEAGHPEAVRRAVKTRPLTAIVHGLLVGDDLEAGVLVRVEPPAPLPRHEYKVVRPRARFRGPAREFCRFLRERLGQDPDGRRDPVSVISGGAA